MQSHPNADYFFPNLFWSLLSVIFGAPAAFFVHYALWYTVDGHDDWPQPVAISLFLYIVWSGGWTILCVWLGGLNVLLITVLVHFGPLTLVLLCKGLQEMAQCNCLQCDRPRSISSSHQRKSVTGTPNVPVTTSVAVEMPNTETSALPVATATAWAG